MANPSLRDWAKDVMSKVKDPVVDFAKHKPTEGELNNLSYLSMKFIAGWGMRSADFAVVKTMGGKPATVNDLDKQFIPQLAEYIWDHLMGEPDEPSTKDVEAAVKAVRAGLYAMDEKARNSTT